MTIFGSKIFLGVKDRFLFYAIILTILINLPFFSPRLVFIHDTLNIFNYNYFVYSQLYFHSELPRWMPVVALGQPSAFYSFGTLQPMAYMTYAIGCIFRIEDALFLFKISALLNQIIFAFGVHLLSKSLFQSPITKACVISGAILTNSWLFQYHWNFLIFYLVPMVLYFLLLFFRTQNISFLWIAGFVQSLSMFGNIQYIAPVYLLMDLVWCLPFILNNPRFILTIFRPKFFLNRYFVLFASTFVILLITVLNVLDETVIVLQDRNNISGNVTKEIFLTHALQPLTATLGAFLKGDVPHGDITCYVGLLPLAIFPLAIRRSRSPESCATLLVMLFLCWFAIGGWFSAAAYYFPLMGKFRHINGVFGLAKFFLIFAGGFGIETLITGNVTSTDSSGFRKGWGLALFFVFIGLVVDGLFHIGNRLPLWPLLSRETEFSGSTMAWFLIATRLILYATATMFFLKERFYKIAPFVLFGAYLFDVSTFYLVVVSRAPFVSFPENNFTVRKLTFQPERGLKELPEDVVSVQKGLRAPRNGLETSSFYASESLVTGVDVGLDVVPGRNRVDLLSKSVFEMTLARWEWFTGKDNLYYKTLGVGAPKIRLVRNVIFAPDLKTSLELFKKVGDPFEMTVLTADPSSASKKNLLPSSTDSVKVTGFSANYIEIEVKATSPAWVYYADAYDPRWNAYVNEWPTKVVRANIGMKAVPVPAGDSNIIFRFNKDWQDQDPAVFFVSFITGIFVLTRIFQILLLIDIRIEY